MQNIVLIIGKRTKQGFQKNKNKTQYLITEAEKGDSGEGLELQY